MTVFIRVAGVTAEDRQEILKSLPYQTEIKFKFVREPDNPFDKDAVAVYTEDNRKVGFVPKTANKSHLISEKMDKGIEFSVIGSVNGGYAPGINFGVILKVTQLKHDSLDDTPDFTAIR